MVDPLDSRPDPDALLQSLKDKEEKEQKAKLTIFLGMCAGVGKTYDMLKTAQELRSKGVDVIVGYVETHRRKDTEALLTGLEIVPRRAVEYGGVRLEEMNLDAVLTRNPAIALVDELAHTNAPGSRHAKRYQDVLELLDHGISVMTTLNVQHVESRADTVAQIAGSIVRETVPDSILDAADEVELVDISPDDLLKRLSEGKVYTAERSALAVQNFFRKGNLTALREMALRLTAERVDQQLREYMQTNRITGPWKSGQRLIVGISASPHSIRLLRWARRMASTMQATWVALHVETSKPLPEAARVQLAKNVKLARELGAEIATTADEDVIKAILRVAKEQNATQILIGKEGVVHPFRGSILKRLTQGSGDLDIYVVGGDKEERQERRKFSLPAITSEWHQYALAAAAVALTSLLCYPVGSVLGYQSVSMIFLLVVTLLPLRLGVGPVLLAAGLSALLWDFLFIPPRFTFTIALPQDFLMLATYFVIASVTGNLTARVRARERLVLQREHHATALYNLTRDLSAAASQDGVAKASVENIARSFGATTVVYLSEPDGDIFKAPHATSSLSVDQKEFSVAAWVYWNEKKAGLHTDTLPFAQATYFPLSGPRYPLGVIGVRMSDGIRMSLDQEALMENFANQIASSLERESLNELAKRSIAVEQSERLYQTLFNSISHEMRTPLSAILGASEGLQDETILTDSTTRGSLIEEIHTAALRLNRLVGNLLDMTRIESGLIRPKLDWCDLNDLVQSALRRLSQDIGHHPVTVDIPQDMPLIRMDFGLMEQVLNNLVYNAIFYTPPDTPILIRGRVQQGECVLEVIDRGVGLPEGEEKNIFEKFYRVPGTKAGGTGLGLSIVKGFVEAHHGTIIAANDPEGGARFIIRIPFQEEPLQKGRA